MGAILAGVAGYVTTMLQQADEDSRALAVAVRADQKTAYLELLAAEQSVQEAELDYDFAVVLQIRGDPAVAQRQLDAATDRLNSSLAPVQLAGSSEASQLAADLIARHNDWETVNNNAEVTIQSYRALGSAAPAAAQPSYDSALQATDGPERVERDTANAFTRQARRDLGSD